MLKILIFALLFCGGTISTWAFTPTNTPTFTNTPTPTVTPTMTRTPDSIAQEWANLDGQFITIYLKAGSFVTGVADSNLDYVRLNGIIYRHDEIAWFKKGRCPC